jgi:hypothetical protein
MFSINLMGNDFLTNKIILESTVVNLVSSLNKNYNINVKTTLSEISNLDIKIPYKNFYKPFQISSYLKEFIISKEYLKNTDSDVQAFFYWDEQILKKGEGYIKAKIYFDKDIDAEFIQINLLDELNLVKVPFPSYKMNEISSLNVKLIGAIKDKEFNSTNKSKYIYFPIKSKKTGYIWLNNNLGAEYNNISSPYFIPQKIASNIKDVYAFGKLYKWEENPCPKEYRLPTKKELELELINYNLEENRFGLTLSGLIGLNNNMSFAGILGNYWTSTFNVDNICEKEVLRIFNNKLSWHNKNNMEYAFSVRCIRN